MLTAAIQTSESVQMLLAWRNEES